MNKKLLTLGTFLSFTTPIVGVVSCGSKAKHRINAQALHDLQNMDTGDVNTDIPELGVPPEHHHPLHHEHSNEHVRVSTTIEDMQAHANTMEASSWLDAKIDETTDVRYINDETGSTRVSEGYFADQNMDMIYKAPGWEQYTKSFDPSEYSKERIKRDFAFMDKDFSNEIHRFITNYFKYHKTANYLGVHPPFANRNSVAHDENDKKIILFDLSVQAMAPVKMLFLFSQLLTTNASLQNGMKTNADVMIDCEPQFLFCPWGAVQNANDESGTNALWDAVKTNFNYGAYNSRFHNDSYTKNNYLALKLLVGNLDLKTSEVYEIVSAAFSEIGAMKKQALVKRLKDENYKVILHGSEHGNGSNVSAALLRPEILDDVHSIYGTGSGLHAAIEGSGSYSGNLDKMQKMTPRNLPIIDYVKMKYGLLKRLDNAFKNNDFKTKFINKTWMHFEDVSLGWNNISDFEKTFYDQHGIKYVISHEQREIFKQMISKSPYTLAAGVDEYVQHVLRDDVSIANNPIYDWKEVYINYGANNE